MTDNTAILPATKVCTKCGLEKKLNLFTRAKRNSSGYASVCNDCTKKANALWREKNRDKIKEYNKRDRRINNEKRKYKPKTEDQKKRATESWHRWYERNREWYNKARLRPKDDDYTDLHPLDERAIGFRSWAVICSVEYAKELTILENSDNIDFE